MPAGVSDYGSATWLGALFGVVPLPDDYFIALCVQQPGAAMDGNILAAIEPADAAYERQPYGIGGDYWAPNGSYLVNLQAVTFPTPVTDWGFLTHFALCSAQSAGQVFCWGEMFNPQFVTSAIGVLVPAGALVLGLHALESAIAV